MEENRITLSKKERLLLANQLEIIKNQMIILKHINKKMEVAYEVKELNNQIKAVEEGYEYHYNEIYGNINDGLSYKECLFVLDVLEMYRGITYSYNTLKRNGILEHLTDDDVIFPGFDLHTETKQYSYARYFILDLDRYSEIQELAGSNYDYNSHTSTTVQKYKNQLRVWEDYKSLENRYSMNEEELTKLLNS